MTLIATQRELLALKRHLAALSPGATPEDIRAEQGRLLDEEIGLVERKLARARAMAADGQDQGVLSDTERELLALQRQRVALASDPLLATTSEAAATLVTDEEEKEKEIRRLQRALFRLRWPTTSPEQMRRQIEAARTAQQERLDAATGLMERLRVSLSVPDDIAVMDADKGMDDPRLVKYRAYFEAKSTRDGARRFGQVLYGKLATEEIELDLFRQYDALDN